MPDLSLVAPVFGTEWVEGKTKIMQKRRRKLPGSICPRCSNIAVSVSIRYKDSRGNDRDVPVRRFVCKCGHSYTFPARDAVHESLPPNQA